MHTFELWQDRLDDSSDDCEELDCDLYKSECDKLDDKFCKVGDGGALRFGVDAGVDDVLDLALSQPTQPVGNLSDNFCCGKSLCSQK